MRIPVFKKAFLGIRDFVTFIAVIHPLSHLTSKSLRLYTLKLRVIPSTHDKDLRSYISPANRFLSSRAFY